MRLYFAHPSALIEDGAEIGAGSRIWHNSHVRGQARIGSDCTIGFSVFIDEHVAVGSRCKIQNHVSLYRGVTIGDDVFIGPGVVFTNDLSPRVLAEEWNLSETTVKSGASIGANATVVCGIEIGVGALVGAGTVVTTDVDHHEVVVGNPARRIGWICDCGARTTVLPTESCGVCGSGAWAVRG